MQTGHKTFDASSQAGLIAAILEHEPAPLSGDAEPGSRLIDRILKRCLQKEPAKRWQSASDLGEVLRWALGSDDRTTASSRVALPLSRGLLWIVAALLVVGLASMFWWGQRRSPGPLQQVRFDIPPPDARDIDLFSAAMHPSLAISPDGKIVVYTVLGPDGKELYQRSLDAVHSSLVPGTEGGENPFFSQDGEWLGFIQEDRLKKFETLAYLRPARRFWCCRTVGYGSLTCAARCEIELLANPWRPILSGLRTATP